MENKNIGVCSFAVVNACESNPCKHGGTCSTNGTGYDCTCMTGYEGDDCDGGWYCVCYYRLIVCFVPSYDTLKVCCLLHNNLFFKVKQGSVSYTTN